MKTKRLGVKAALVDGTLVPGDIEIDDTIVSLGLEPAGTDGIAIPGFIDLQVNGYGGVDFLTTDIEGFRTAGDALVATGVTAYLPTLVSAPQEQMHEALGRANKARDYAFPKILGVHLEGPFLNPIWKGAQDETWIVPPDITTAERLCDWGIVSIVTMAPEVEGGWELLDYLVSRGVIVSIGHTDADAATAHAAFNRGARAVTHLHNAQRRFTARDPGISGVAQTRTDVTVMVIGDLVHVAPETLLLAYKAARSHFAVVTDAIPAAPNMRGEFTLGTRTIIAHEDVARLADGTIAGSLLSMDRAVRNLVELGVPLADAIHATTTVPARLLGRAELGTLRVSTPADVTVLDDDLHVVRTIVDGREVFAR